MSRNSITPSRAFFTVFVRVKTSGGSPDSAHDACGFGRPFTSTRHMRQLPAIESRSW